MRTITVLLTTLLLASGIFAQVTRSDSSSGSSRYELMPDSEKVAIDSTLQFLLTSAATDFHKYAPSPVAGFRNVQIGHLVSPEGKVVYMLCGEYQLLKDEHEGEWTPFATIRTSGYEQYVGPQALTFCRNASVVWDNVGDLSSTLKSVLDSLK